MTLQIRVGTLYKYRNRIKINKNSNIYSLTLPWIKIKERLQMIKTYDIRHYVIRSVNILLL